MLSIVAAIPVKKKAKQILQYIGTLLLILTLIAPVAKIEVTDIAVALSKFQMQTQQGKSGVEVKNRQIVSQLIQEQCQAYILDKGNSMSLKVVAEVHMDDSGNYPYPVSVKISGQASSAEKAYLLKIIEQDLGIPPSEVIWD